MIAPPTRCLLLHLLTAAVLSGCGSSAPAPAYRKPANKVTGRITVDGAAPKSAIQVECVPINVKDSDPAHYSMSTGSAKEDGTLEITTYETGDGVPDGEYGLIFTSRDFNIMQRTLVGPDKLKGRYSDKKKPFKTFKVEGQPVDLGEIKLTTK